MKQRFIKVENKAMEIHSYLVKLSNLRLVMLFVVANLVLAYLFSFLSVLFSSSPIKSGFPEFDSFWQAVLLSIIFAPFFETVIFQLGIIETARKKLSPLITCLLSASLFALVHFYNIFYVILTFGIGLNLAYLYLIGGSMLRGFLLTWIAHILHNSIATALHYL